MDAAVARIAAIEEYHQIFQEVSGHPPNGADLVRAIVSYERTQVSFDSPFDYFIAGDRNAIDDSAKRGWELSNICGRPLSGKGKRWDRCCAWSNAVICPAFDAAGTQPPACMGVRGPGPDHPKRARSTVESPGCPGPVSPTVAPYSPSARPHVLAIVVSLRRRGRSSIGAAFDQQGPDDAGHLVGQSNGDQHFRLASQHLRKPRALGCPAPARLLNHGTRPNDQ